MLAVLSPRDVALFGILLFVTVLIFAAFFFYNLWLRRISDSLSPYTKLPMRRGAELSYGAAEKVLRFLFKMHQYDNRIFDLRQSAVCRETGRIFPNALTWYDKIKLDWSFLQKRYPGKYVSWGSLTPEQQVIVLSYHDNLEGFQTDFSSKLPQPNAVEAPYVFAKPGPLYVDIDTGVLLGWKCVPDTELEVLIVQKPVEIHTITVT